MGEIHSSDETTFSDKFKEQSEIIKRFDRQRKITATAFQNGRKHKSIKIHENVKRFETKCHIS